MFLRDTYVFVCLCMTHAHIVFSLWMPLHHVKLKLTLQTIWVIIDERAKSNFADSITQNIHINQSINCKRLNFISIRIQSHWDCACLIQTWTGWHQIHSFRKFIIHFRSSAFPAGKMYRVLKMWCNWTFNAFQIQFYILRRTNIIHSTNKKNIQIRTFQPTNKLLIIIVFNIINRSIWSKFVNG